MDLRDAEQHNSCPCRREFEHKATITDRDTWINVNPPNSLVVKPSYANEYFTVIDSGTVVLGPSVDRPDEATNRFTWWMKAKETPGFYIDRFWPRDTGGSDPTINANSTKDTSPINPMLVVVIVTPKP